MSFDSPDESDVRHVFGTPLPAYRTQAAVTRHECAVMNRLRDRGASTAEIASATGRPPRTVRSHSLPSGTCSHAATAIAFGECVRIRRAYAPVKSVEAVADRMGYTNHAVVAQHVSGRHACAHPHPERFAVTVTREARDHSHRWRYACPYCNARGSTNYRETKRRYYCAECKRTPARLRDLKVAGEIGQSADEREALASIGPGEAPYRKDSEAAPDRSLGGTR